MSKRMPLNTWPSTLLRVCCTHHPPRSELTRRKASYPWRPCNEVNTKETDPENDPVFMGRTFMAYQSVNGQESEKTPPYVGIILCPEQKKWARDPETRELIDITLVGTLGEDFDATPADGQKYSYPADYNSLAGTLLHEMGHVVGRMEVAKVEDSKCKWEQTTQGDDKILTRRSGKDKAYGFKECAKLAKDSQETALTNPDTYRVFSEMSMAKTDTKWGMKKA